MATSVPESTSRNKGTCMIYVASTCIAVVLVIIALAVAVGIVFGVADNNSPSENSSENAIVAAISAPNSYYYSLPSPTIGPGGGRGISALRGSGAPSAAPTTPGPAAVVQSARPRRSSVVFALLPDTQYYSAGAPYIYLSQARWISANAAALGRPFVMHLGDLVQSAGRVGEWRAADEAMSLLEAAGVSYSAAPGNHDLTNAGPDAARDHGAEDYLRFFSEVRAAAQAQRTFRGRDPLGYSEYHLVAADADGGSADYSADGLRFLVMALDWRASRATLVWARRVLEEFPSVPTIVTSHEFLAPRVGGGVVRTGYGQVLWDDLIRSNDQVFLVTCGHNNGTGHRIDGNDFDHPVLSLLVDYQAMHAGGNGYMRLMELDFFHGTIEHLTFSPFVMDLYSDGGADALDPLHDVAELADPANKYIVRLNLTKRFHEMNATVPPSMAASPSPSLLDPVRIALTNVSSASPPATTRRKPNGPHDYQNISDTLAHWRFDSSGNVARNGGALTPLETIKDLSGRGNDMVREDVGGSQPSYLTWSTDHHPLSASAGSICFSNPDRSSGGFLTTLPGSPLDAETFPDGYTIEAFVKLAPTWDNKFHRWTGAVSRGGEGVHANKTGGDPLEPLATLGFSPGREVQYATFPENYDGVVTAWSSPIDVDRWYHLAVVNNGETTHLHIDGYPSRRDPVHADDVRGIATGNFGWRVGASSYNGRRKVFGGCIGEVRIAGRALSREEFLFARASTK